MLVKVWEYLSITTVTMTFYTAISIALMRKNSHKTFPFILRILFHILFKSYLFSFDLRRMKNAQVFPSRNLAFKIEKRAVLNHKRSQEYFI